jgi:hypothetical protein
MFVVFLTCSASWTNALRLQGAVTAFFTVTSPVFAQTSSATARWATI